ncbi:hypothetical protein KSS87_014616 [Heliosperma pusillum]|nr:hypothetical protein KSS87_014616 [Heliosperma pusillum]
MAPTASNNNAGNLYRQTANFDPSVWGDFFVTYACDNKDIQVWLEEAKMLKEEVQKMLKDDFTIEHLSEKLSIIDAVERLGIAYHFETEIQDMFQRVFELFNDEINHEHYELVTLALLFRLLRQHGYNVSSEIFSKFKDNKDELKDLVTEDVEGMISLYEATHLRLHGETILEKALGFTKNALELKLPSLRPSIAARVSHTLRCPVQKRLPRLGAREYISLYQDKELHNQVLLKFAKLDFNLLQLQHIQELSIISKWWKELDVKNKLPYARDRITECYFWILGVYYEPQYALARRFSTKVIALTSLMDDTYDVYDEKASESVSRGSKMACRKKVPTMEEYMRVVMASTAYPMLAMVSLVGMGEAVNEDAFLWLLSEPPLLRSICCICRFMDDIVSRQEYKVTESEACKVLSTEIENAWKDINQAFLEPNAPSMHVLMRLLNLARVMELLYTGEDMYTHSHKSKPLVASLLLNPLQI